MNSWIESIFKKKEGVEAASTVNDAITKDDISNMYDRPDSFTDLLPWVDYDSETKTFLLEDGYSVGVMFEMQSVPTEGKPMSYLKEIEDNIISVLNHSIPEEDNPYILQCYVQDQQTLKDFQQEYEDYIPEEIRNTEFSQHFISDFKEHIRRVSNPKGFFEDKMVTGGIWNGKIRRVRMFLYRRFSASEIEKIKSGTFDSSPEELINEVTEKFLAQISAVGNKIRRCNAEDLYYWLLEWFNPESEVAGGNIDKLKEIAPYPGDKDLPFGVDLARLVTLTQPVSDAKYGTWSFDGLPHRAIIVDGLRRAPEPGHLTGERRIGENLYAVFDRLPAGSILGFTIVIEAQDVVGNRITTIQNASKGDKADAALAGEDAGNALRKMAQGDNLYPTVITLFIRGTDQKDLKKKVNSAHALLTSHGLSTINEKNELLPLETYIRQLPMNYEPSKEKIYKTNRLMFSSHLARLMPFYGRERGTGNHGLVFFNRGAEPLTFDPLNSEDRSKNAFGLVLGPPGSGKSALMVYILLLFMARYRPRIFIIEKGGSFRLFGDHCENLGLTVNSVTLHPKNDVALPCFADAIKMLECEEEKKKKYATDSESLDVEELIHARIEDLEPEAVMLEIENANEDDDEGEERDYLGEMELAARVMITGGDIKEEERLKRSDRLLIRKSIVNAAVAKRVWIRAKEANGAKVSDLDKQVITSDVVAAMLDLGKEPGRRPKSVERAHDMAESMELFCEGTQGHFFNRPGQMWPECDVTIMEMGIFANEGYEDGLTLAFMSLMNIITAIVERDQNEERPTVVLGDEAHLFTTNPLLAPYLVKVIKMFRKLGCWLWLATQNLEDFPNESRKMLSMFEWFIAMTCPKDQIELISEFKDLTPEKKSMLLAARKEPRKYTEGVVIAENIVALFRNVPPPLALALAMTEKHEKAERMKIMQREGCTELESVYLMAKEMGESREKEVLY